VAYFVRIGANLQNDGGIESRGYHIYRRGNRVFTVWGAVEVRPGRRVYWCGTRQFKQFTCASPDAAERKRTALIAERATSHGYSRLPTGAHVLSEAKSRKKTRMFR
jgi:hypothetical protein